MQTSSSSFRYIYNCGIKTPINLDPNDDHLINYCTITYYNFCLFFVKRLGLRIEIIIKDF